MTLQIDRIIDLTPDPSFPPLSDFLAVGAHGCRWPGVELECCGRMVRDHSPYCDHHHKLAFRRTHAPHSDAAIERMHCAGLKRMASVNTLRKLATAEELGL